MDVTKVQITQPENHTCRRALVAGTVGLAAGAGARYIVPTKDELSSIVNKDAVDTFVSSTATAARGAKRSILKYGGIGALIAAGISLLHKAFKGKSPDTKDNYSKVGALIDAPDYAVEIMWYGE